MYLDQSVGVFEDILAPDGGGSVCLYSICILLVFACILPVFCMYSVCILLAFCLYSVYILLVTSTLGYPQGFA